MSAASGQEAKSSQRDDMTQTLLRQPHEEDSEDEKVEHTVGQTPVALTDLAASIQTSPDSWAMEKSDKKLSGTAKLIS